MRSFIAILLSEDTRKGLAQTSKKLKLTGADVKWVEKENFHITLCFLGDIDSRTCKAIITGMSEITPSLDPFTVSLYGINAFPNLKRPRVIWAGIRQGKKEITEVHRRILPVIRPLGFAEEKKFAPHVTIGRVRSQEKLDRLAPAAESVHELGEELIQGVSLMESILTPKGPVYSELAFSKFAGSC